MGENETCFCMLFDIGILTNITILKDGADEQELKLATGPIYLHEKYVLLFELYQTCTLNKRTNVEARETCVSNKAV